MGFFFLIKHNNIKFIVCYSNVQQKEMSLYLFFIDLKSTLRLRRKFRRLFLVILKIYRDLFESPFKIFQALYPINHGYFIPCPNQSN